MIRLIFNKELKEIFRTSKMTWMLAGVFLLLGMAIYNGHTYYHTQSSLLRESQELTYRQFITQGDKNPHLGAHFGFYAYKPTADLAMVDNGLEAYTGNSFYLEPHKRGVVKFIGASDATALGRFGFLNIGYFTQFILPIFIFLCCFNIFSKEWENGTIKMILSSRARPLQIFLGKLYACLAIVGLIIFTLALISFILLVAEHQLSGIPALLPAYFSYIVGLMLFAFVITLITVTISLLTRSSSLSLIVLSAFWLIGVFLGPRLSAEISKNKYPSITSMEFDEQNFNQMQYGVNGEGHKDVRRELLLQRTLKAYKVTKVEDLPVYFIPITIEYFEESDGKVMDKAYQQVEDNQRKQDRFVLAAAVCSPFMAFRDLSMHIAATDMDTHHDFSMKAELHRRRTGTIVDDFYQQNVTGGNAFWKTVPQFSYTLPGISVRLYHARTSILILLGWAVFALILMVYSLKKITA